MTLRWELVATWVAVVATTMAAWGLAAATLPLPDYYLPPPTAVLAALGELVTKGILPTYVAESVRRLLLAAALGLIVGVPVGLILGMSRRVADFFYPLLNFFQSVSGIAWLPLMLVWFGFGERTILVAVNYTVLFPVIFNALLCVRSVPTLYVNALRTLGAPRWRIVRDVLVPGALPSIATGMRLGLAYGWRALIAAEMLVGAHGLGFMIFNAQNFHLTARIMLGMGIIGVLWVVLDYFLLRPLEEATIARWGLLQR
ncbi:MAG: ABC transporter permease [Candidatus Rokubacteria bacterium]|nr:ABC transporter permease [Candidatus Rokubacteria bacterium]